MTRPPVYRDPFDPARRLPPGVIVALPDHEGGYVARRAGTLHPDGSGDDQLSAVLDLERRERVRKRKAQLAP